MSLFAGYYKLKKDVSCDPLVEKNIVMSLTNDPDYTKVIKTDQFFLVKFDYGAFNGSGVLIEEMYSVLAGDLLLKGQKGERINYLKNIAEYISVDEYDILKDCYGNFAVCFFHPKKNILILLTDRLGIRPIYYVIIEDILYFSCNLKTLANSLLDKLSLNKTAISEMSASINEIGFSAFSKIQENKENFIFYFHRATNIIAFVSFPIFWGISSVAPEVVSIFLGDQWQMAVFPLQILSLVGPLRMLSNAVSPALLALGRPDVGFFNLVWGCTIMIPAFFIGSFLGLWGVSLSWMCAYPLFFIIRMRRSLPIIGIPSVEYFTDIRWVFVFTAVMYLSVYITRYVLYLVSYPTIVEMVLLITIGGATFIGLNWIFRKEFFIGVLALIQK